ncbi:hypothetical protein SALBM217S_08250 [Streptomyces griseoloalbus]
MEFEPSAMRDVDRWVRHNARHMLFVYGENNRGAPSRSAWDTVRVTPTSSPPPA